MDEDVPSSDGFITDHERGISRLDIFIVRVDQGCQVIVVCEGVPLDERSYGQGPVVSLLG